MEKSAVDSNDTGCFQTSTVFYFMEDYAMTIAKFWGSIGSYSKIVGKLKLYEKQTLV